MPRGTCFLQSRAAPAGASVEAEAASVASSVRKLSLMSEAHERWRRWNDDASPPNSETLVARSWSRMPGVRGEGMVKKEGSR